MASAKQYKWRGTGRKVLLVILILVFSGIFLFGRQGLLNWYKLRRTSQQMEASNDSLVGAIEALSARIQAIEEGDSLELEKLARHWGMVRDGEEIYLIRDDEDTTQISPY
jgi:cell division protein FtsB